MSKLELDIGAGGMGKVALDGMALPTTRVEIDIGINRPNRVTFHTIAIEIEGLVKSEETVHHVTMADRMGPTGSGHSLATALRDLADQL